MIDIEIAVDSRATIGESPTWCPAEHALYWIDVKRPALHRYDPRSGATRTWLLTSDIGAFALCAGGSALVALRHGLHRLDLASGALDLLASPLFDPKLFRFNEGLCDRTGRFWVGVMCDPVDGSPERQRACLHSFTFAEGLRQEDDRAELHNGMAVSDDGTKLFLAHSNEGAIYQFDFDAVTGSLGPRRKFAQVSPSLGLPDGAAIDEEGCYWCAIHGGGRLRRYAPHGAMDREILLPVSKPTMCAFAGDDLDILYVTSASEGLDEADEPLAGALLRLRPGVRGIVRPYRVK